MLTLVRRSIGLLLFLVVWELLGVTGAVSRDYLPGIGSIAGALVKLVGSQSFAAGFAATLQRTVFGLIIAVALALVLAVATGRFPILRRMLEPTVDILRSLPPPALLPLLIFVLGIGGQLFYVIVIYGCIWPTYISASNALATAEVVQIQTARSYGLSKWQIMWQVRLPAALPEAFTGIRLSAAIALLATVATEMMVGGSGLGGMIYDAGFSQLWARMYALLFVIGVTGMVLNGAVSLLRWGLVGWQEQFAMMGSAT
ncbi:ABC transporter permease subunit [Thioclava sp. BHET1]|nr:ABC transporter permease subunit [Thioclava sp. BHET1]